MKRRRTLSVIFMVFHGYRTILPIVLAYLLIESAFVLIFPGTASDEMIDMSGYSTPLLLIILGGVLAYRLTGIAAANSAGKRAAAFGVIVSAVPVAVVFAGVDVLTKKLLMAKIYGKPVRFFLEPFIDTGWYEINKVCDIADVRAMLVLFGLTVLLYFWALLAGYILGMFITNRSRTRLTVMIVTAALSLVLYFITNMTQEPLWGIGILVSAAINPVVFVYASYGMLYYARTADFSLGWMTFIVCAVSLISILGNMLLLKINIPVYKHSRHV